MSYSATGSGAAGHTITIHPTHWHATLPIWAACYQNSVYGSAAYPGANRAILCPFVLPLAATVRKLGWFNGGTVSGNVDAAIYDSAGTRLVSTGSTAQSGTTAYQMVDVTDTLLPARRLYYLAIACDNGTATFYRISMSGFVMDGSGFRQKATSFPLPDPLTTTAAISSGYIPLVLAEMEVR